MFLLKHLLHRVNIDAIRHLVTQVLHKRNAVWDSVLKIYFIIYWKTEF